MTSKIFLKYKRQSGKLTELYNPWKDGCLSFGTEVIQITKYYRETPESRPIEKCKVQVNFQHIETIKNDNERLLLLISTPSEELIFQFQCLGDMDDCLAQFRVNAKYLLQ